MKLTIDLNDRFGVHYILLELTQISNGIRMMLAFMSLERVVFGDERVGKAFDQLSLHCHCHIVDCQIGDRFIERFSHVFNRYIC